MNKKSLRIAFAGDREIAVKVLKHILADGVKPLALLTSSQKKATHADQLIQLSSHLTQDYIMQGTTFREEDALEKLKQLKLDYIICIHFPYIIPESVLDIPRIGVVNLHPAYLPYNRGWHTPSWAILQNTPYGATCHFMDAGVDTGDIIHQEQIEISPADTANSLYARVLDMEFEVFKTCWPGLRTETFARTKQPHSSSEAHRKQDLFQDSVQRIDLDKLMPAGDLIRQIRALSTNNIKEAAYFESNGRKYRMQIKIEEEVTK